mmetsp:Transcript_25968/g.25218  ORF Transcript_25968/g.25218 Transcript_25968/m.25218 type:complete len:104 (-) Transcript_25968:581-892(-)
MLISSCSSCTSKIHGLCLGFPFYFKELDLHLFCIVDRILLVLDVCLLTHHFLLIEGKHFYQLVLSHNKLVHVIKPISHINHLVLNQDDHLLLLVLGLPAQFLQ